MWWDADSNLLIILRMEEWGEVGWTREVFHRKKATRADYCPLYDLNNFQFSTNDFVNKSLIANLAINEKRSFLVCWIFEKGGRNIRNIWEYLKTKTIESSFDPWRQNTLNCRPRFALSAKMIRANVKLSLEIYRLKSQGWVSERLTDDYQLKFDLMLYVRGPTKVKWVWK